MAQGAEILERWATLLSSGNGTEHAQESSAPETHYAAEAAQWREIANEFTVKTRLMWQDGWFRDYDSVAKEWSTEQDTMHLAPVFCGTGGWGHKEQLRPYFSQPPNHSGWTPLCWPPVVMTLTGAAVAAALPLEAAELAYRFIDASYRSIDSREPDEHGGLPGVTREYRQVSGHRADGSFEYVNAGIEGYGWGALSIHLLIRYLLGLREEARGVLTVAPMLPATLRRDGALYRRGTYPMGAIYVECGMRCTREQGMP